MGVPLETGVDYIMANLVDGVVSRVRISRSLCVTFVFWAQGDSGGPLVCQVNPDGEGPYELVGITSWGLSGCGTDYPSVYVRVSTFREWLDSVIAEQ